MLVDTTRKLLEDLSHKKLDGVRILEEMEKIAGENIGKTFFSEDLENYTVKGKSLTINVMDTLTKIGQVMMSPGHLIFGPKYVEKSPFNFHKELGKDVKLIETTCQKIIDDRRNSKIEKPKDLVWYLLESQKNSSKEDRLCDETIIGNYAVFIVAGTGTTSHLVAMTLYALAQNPDILSKLKEEIRDIYNKESHPSTDTLNKMNWLSAILKETERMYNPIGIGAGFRTASKDHKIGDIQIKAGTMVGASFVHNAFESTYFENPPFWAGPRNYIGQHLAVIESKIIVCEFIKKFEFEMVSGFKLKLGIKRAYGPVDDLPMNLKIRSENL